MDREELNKYIDTVKFALRYYNETNNENFCYATFCSYCPIAYHNHKKFDLPRCGGKDISPIPINYERRIEQLKIFLNKYDNKINKLKAILEDI